MNILSVFIIALSLSMDCFALSLINGLSFCSLDKKKKIVISLSFAIFHIVLLLSGWILGKETYQYFELFDHWVAFFLLAIIGGKMIFESIMSKNNIKKQPFNWKIVLSQSLACSIDAFAIGISFVILNASVYLSLSIIFLTVFFVSYFGINLGKYFGKKIGKYANIIGGIVLIGIGVKIIIEHLCF